ncbi:MAG: hypothetical protein Fur009_7490 [Candidatus Microgenomates bacterium]
MEFFENLLLFFVLIAFLFSLLNKLFEKSKLPVYPFYLLIFLILHFLKFDTFDNQFLKPNFDLIYDIFLPIILFESAININIHRFKIQFKTIFFLTTVALIFNAFLFALFLLWLFKIPIQYGLIFGTLISATDPIGVLAIFKNLKIPHRLKLLIEGESMLNDATTIIFFELLIILFVEVTKDKLPFFIALELITKKFFLSLFLGVLIGFILVLITRLFKKDSLLINILTFFLILSFYFLGEKFIHLSGPILIIFAGLVYSNFSFPFLEEEDFEKNKYLFSFLALLINLYFFSIVGLNTNLSLIYFDFFNFLKLIFILFLTRSISVYLNFYITNKNKLFYDEPDVYSSWQHIINFGGLRGVIPLILVNQLSDDFIYKNLFYNFTIYSFIVTNLINPFIVFYLIKKYEKNFYSKIFKIKNLFFKIYNLVKEKNHLLNDLNYFPKTQKQAIEKNIIEVNNKINKSLKDILIYTDKEIYNGLHFLGANIEKESFRKAYEQKQIKYFNYLKMISELDLQIDALIYPEKFAGRVIDDKGFIKSKKSWRLLLIEFFEKFGFSLQKQQKILEQEKNNLLKERIISSMRMIEEINYLKKSIKNERIIKIFNKITKDHQFWINYNLKKIKN